MKPGWWILKFSVMGILAIALVGFAVTSLWNWLVPALFSGPVLTFWQALGLLVLSKILLWPLSGRRHHYPYAARANHFKSHWKEKWNGLSPEEKEKLKQKFARCGWTTDGWDAAKTEAPAAGPDASQSM